jgi:hypothetical protein
VLDVRGYARAVYAGDAAYGCDELRLEQPLHQRLVGVVAGPVALGRERVHVLGDRGRSLLEGVHELVVIRAGDVVKVAERVDGARCGYRRQADAGEAHDERPTAGEERRRPPDEVAEHVGGECVPVGHRRVVIKVGKSLVQCAPHLLDPIHRGVLKVAGGRHRVLRHGGGHGGIAREDRAGGVVAGAPLEREDRIDATVSNRRVRAAFWLASLL